MLVQLVTGHLSGGPGVPNTKYLLVIESTAFYYNNSNVLTNSVVICAGTTTMTQNMNMNHTSDQWLATSD